MGQSTLRFELMRFIARLANISTRQDAEISRILNAFRLDA